MLFNKASNNKKGRVRRICFGLIFLLIITVSVVVFGRYSTDTSTGLVCTDDKELLAKIGAQLNPNNLEQISQAIETTETEIETRPEYKQDFNCVYPVAVISVYKGVVDKADDHIKLLDKLIQEENQNLSPAYSYITSIESLSASVAGQRSISTGLTPLYDVSNGPVPPPPPLTDNNSENSQ